MTNTLAPHKPKAGPGNGVSRQSFKRLLDSDELADAINASVRTIERLREAGMPHFRLGHRSPRYDLDEVLQWLKERSHIIGTGSRIMMRKPV